LGTRISGLEPLAIGLQGYATQKGTLFRITSIARVKETSRTVEAVIRLPDVGTPVTLSWQEY